MVGKIIKIFLLLHETDRNSEEHTASLTRRGAGWTGARKIDTTKIVLKASKTAMAQNQSMFDIFNCL